MLGIFIKETGHIEEFNWDDNHKFHELIGTEWIDFATVVRHRFSCVIDDFGAINGSLFNPVATEVIQTFGRRNTMLYGPVAFIGFDGIGRDADLPLQVTAVCNAFKRSTSEEEIHEVHHSGSPKEERQPC
jgi:hypothetical protein